MKHIVTLSEEELCHLPCDVLKHLVQHDQDVVLSHLESCEECKLCISRFVLSFKATMLGFLNEEFPTMQALQIVARQQIRLSRKKVIV